MIKEAFHVCKRSPKTSQRDHHDNVDGNENPKQQKIRRGRWQVQERSRLAIDQFVALPPLTGPNAKTMMGRRAGRHESRHSLSLSADHAIERGVVQFVASNLKHALAFIRAPGNPASLPCYAIKVTASSLGIYTLKVLGNNNSDNHGLTEGRCWKMKQHKRR
ncbi:unnamed protein product [Sphagnum jensenii]|uniref:Uncharacterized protein n=1 Tax=Sphagnum jensenii TaxID=128206 RepID=A0ABP1B1J1_9BRYO